MSIYQNRRIKNGDRFKIDAQFYLKKWSLFLLLFLLMVGLSPAAKGFAACEYLSSGDFSSGSGWAANLDSATWTIVDGMLDVKDIDGASSYAIHDFLPPDFFSIETDISIVSATGEFDRVGVYVYTSGDVFFAINGGNEQYTTDGVLAYYYPGAGLLKFKFYDFVAGEWVTMQSYPVSGPVNSFGLSMVADRVIFRINGQDTNYEIFGDFSFASYTIDTLELRAGGSGLHARFDNVCASSYEVSNFPPGSAMPLPNGQEVLTTTPAVSPVVSIDPAQANPFGLGSVASSGDILSFMVALSGLAAPVDLYLGLGVGSETYLFAADNTLHPLTAGLIKWRSNTSGGINVRILPDIDMSAYPGNYTFYLLMAPAGRMDVFRLWVTPLQVGDGTSVITDKIMEQEIKQNIDLIFGITSGFSGGLEELLEIFSDENVVTTSPAELSLDSLLSGTPITITADFGSGYTMESGSVMSGNAQIMIFNVKFGMEGMGADFTGTFNVMKDGAPFVNGQVSGSILLTPGANDTSIISGQIIVSNLSVSGQQLSGTIQISGTLDELNLSSLSESRGTIRLTFANFIAGAYTVNSGYVDIVMAQRDRVDVITNLQTSEGPVILSLVLTMTEHGQVLNTSVPGTIGPYTVSISNVALDQDICPNYPIGGTISFTKSVGPTGVVTFTGACDGSYLYSER